jgi:hypothetical protein
MLRDDQWARIEQLLPGKKSDPGCTAKDSRRYRIHPSQHLRFFAEIIWQVRTDYSPRLARK